MNTNHKPISKLRIALMWLFLVANVVFWIWLWTPARRPAFEQAAPGLFESIFRFIIGGFFLVIGAAAYAVVLLTSAFTFDFTRPVWPALKPKLFLANIFVPLLLAMGVAFPVSGVFGPMLVGAGFNPQMANFLPFMAVIAVWIMAQVWVLAWAPVEKQVIIKRLIAQGVTTPQVQSGILVGISNPASGFGTRFAAVEEDIGVLWVGPDQLVYWGDGERFAATREQVLQIERRADNRGQTVLGGVRHVILHLAPPGGGERQVRLHVEGLWTLGQKRRVMNHLAEQIEAWHAHPAPAAA